jgi:hypothetical protein
VRGSTDAALALAARTLINRRLQDIGEVTELALDTAEQSLRASVVLKGEPVPVDVDVRRYELEHSHDGSTLTLVDATASRPWIDETLRAFVIGRPLHVPAKAAAALRLLA